MDEVRNPLILCDIYHRQNPIETIHICVTERLETKISIKTMFTKSPYNVSVSYLAIKTKETMT
jgi:hypothetical protein